MTYSLAGVRIYYKPARGYYRTGSGQAWLVAFVHGQRVVYHLMSETTLNTLLAGEPLAVAA